MPRRAADAQWLQRLRATPLARVHGSDAIDRLGWEPHSRTVVVVFKGGTAAYGYPGLDDDEVRGLLEVIEHGASLGHYIATVVKPRHDHERVQL